MAARKKGPVGTGSLFIASPPPVHSPPKDPGTPVVAERVFRIVPPAQEEDVTIEAAPGSDEFWLTFTRHDGTTRGSVLVTRSQLEKLIRRAPAALEVG